MVFFINKYLFTLLFYLRSIYFKIIIGNPRFRLSDKNLLDAMQL